MERLPGRLAAKIPERDVDGRRSAHLRATPRRADVAAQNAERLYRERGLMAYLVLCLVLFVAIMFIQIPWLYQFFNVQPSPVPPLWRL